MKEEIYQMARLQRVENEIRTVRSRLAGVDQKIARLAADDEAADAGLAGETEGLESIRRQYRDMEGEVQMNTDAAAKKKARLNTLKTNKEYQAMLREIDDLEKKNRAMEEAMLKFLEEIEAGETALTERQAEAGRVKGEVAAAMTQVREAAKKDEARLAELAEERKTVAAELPEKLLAAYERTARRVSPPTMVPVTGPSCEGCNLNLPPQMRNELQRFEDLKYCPFCHRIVYWKGA
jgi:predicted  nucleic acid-binding Zn-ribbon protein